MIFDKKGLRKVRKIVKIIKRGNRQKYHETWECKRGEEMSINYGLTQEQKQLLSQTQMQSLKLLNMCNLELNSFLNNEYLENPLLEHKAGNGTPGVTEEFELWYHQNQSFNEGYGDCDKNESHFRENIPIKNENELRTYLKDQLNSRQYSKQEWKLIDFLIMNLDDNGFYTTSIEETAKAAGVSIEMTEKCLKDLRQLEPAGVFAENLSECLLRQLEELGVQDENLEGMIRFHLEDISKGRISNITRHLGISSAQTRKYIAFIGTLNPRPLAGFSSGSNSYVIPDIMFVRKDNTWEIKLNDKWMGKYYLNEYYLKMIAESKDEELQTYFRKKLERARFILNSIEQRKKTILSISEAVLEWQRGFFEENKELVPMTMAQMAEKLDIHPSTVSRTVNGKYIQYPQGTILMKNLFAAGMNNDSSMSVLHIKKMIKELIDSEDKNKPYSDQVLMNLLKNQGISLSRRAVAKYREEMGILGSFQRKQIL